MLENYQDLIDELLDAPREIRGIIGADPASVPPAALSLLSALRVRDAAVLDRLQRMTREDMPDLRALPAFETPAEMADHGDLAELLATFEANRGELVSLLMNLTLKDWERVATHDVHGETTLAAEVEEHVDYDEALRAELARVVA